MKNLIVITLMIFGIGLFSFAQEINQVRFDASSADVKKSLEAGTATFFFNKNVDGDAIKTNAGYYTRFFATTYDKASGKCQLKLTDEEMARMVISRFLMSNGITEVLIEGKVISVQDFIAEYLR
jgi:hypothetical protein